MHRGSIIENERMVNSMLVNIDKLNPNAIFIGATNRKSSERRKQLIAAINKN